MLLGLSTIKLAEVRAHTHAHTHTRAHTHSHTHTHTHINALQEGGEAEKAEGKRGNCTKEAGEGNEVSPAHKTGKMNMRVSVGLWVCGSVLVSVSTCVRAMHHTQHPPT